MNKLLPILALLFFSCDGGECNCIKYKERAYNIFKNSPINWKDYPERSKRTKERASKEFDKYHDCMNRCGYNTDY